MHNSAFGLGVKPSGHGYANRLDLLLGSQLIAEPEDFPDVCLEIIGGIEFPAGARRSIVAFIRKLRRKSRHPSVRTSDVDSNIHRNPFGCG